MNLLNRLKSIRLFNLLLAFALTLCFTAESFSQEIQRVRLNFTAPDSSVRQILLAFTPDNSATDDFDYGWDAINWSSYNNDLNWMIEGYRCTVQAVGQFANTKSYPLHLIIGNTGNMNIALHSLENFEEDIDVFIYDSLTETFHLINEESLNQEITEGEHANRYFITFVNNIQQQSSLSNEEYSKKNLDVKYLSNTKELYINSFDASKINKIETYSIQGQLLQSYNAEGKKYFKTKLFSTNRQTLIVRITTESGTISKKIII